MLYDNNIDNFSAILRKQRGTPARAEGFSERAGAWALRLRFSFRGPEGIPFVTRSLL